MRDAIIIGGGHNGLVAAAFLGRAGLKPLVLERRAVAGGCAAVSEIAPGFHCPVLSQRAAIEPEIVRTLDLERHGLRVVKSPALVCAPTGHGRALTLWRSPADAAREIAPFSARDAERYPQFVESVDAIGAVLHRLAVKPPPPAGRPGVADLIELLRTGRAYRGLAKRDAYRLLRWLPMPIADFAREWFESEPLCATIAATGVGGTFAGPRSPGTTAVALWLSAGKGDLVAPGWSAKGGMGAVTEALTAAARRAGAEIRTGVEVSRVVVRDGAARGVILSSGEEIAAARVLSNVDPRRTLLGFVGPEHLPPDYQRAVRNIRMRGALATVSYAVSALPAFSDLAGRDPAESAAALSGCIRLCRGMDALERAFDAAKYGTYAEEPWVELTIPSLADPGLAPAGCHVVSAHVLFAPYELRGTTWDAERERFGDVVTGAIARYAPGFERSVIARTVLTPLDLEREYGLTGGHAYHGEIALDQLLLARPLLGSSRYRTPVRNLFLCGSGTHPGTGLDGRAGWIAAGEISKAR